MKIITEQPLRDFQFWSGAKDNAKELTYEQWDELESMLDDIYPDGLTDTQLNDIMWFSYDEVREWLNISDECNDGE